MDWGVVEGRREKRLQPASVGGGRSFHVPTEPVILPSFADRSRLADRLPRNRDVEVDQSMLK